MSWLIWSAWTAVFALYETWALINRKDDDTLSENVRRLFHIRTLLRNSFKRRVGS